MIFSIKVSKYMLILASIAVVFVVLVSGIIIYDKIKSPKKIDRNNIIEVGKPVAIEQLSPSVPDFFTEYRIERDKFRAERSEIVRENLKNAKNEEVRGKAQEFALKTVLEKQQETEMENLIKAKGFADALVFVRDNSVSVVVKSVALSRDEAVQIADIINRTSGIKTEDITISAKP